MRAGTESIFARTGPHSVLLVGCGLIGTSLALAWKEAYPGILIDGVDTRAEHREVALAMGAVETVLDAVPHSGSYDLAVLAVPIDSACELLPQASGVARFVMDVCSVKQPICDVASALHMTDRFAPTHPMAGLAVGGPEHATASLFADRPWIILENWIATTDVAPLIAATRARTVLLQSAHDHDIAMAGVSHAVHLASLATMLAYADAERDSASSWAAVTGPGFRDITRLSSSPPDFWVQTLMANRRAVLEQLARLSSRLDQFASAVAHTDDTLLTALLREAQTAHFNWKGRQT